MYLVLNIDTLQMLLCNDVSRYHVAATAVHQGALYNARVQPAAHEFASLFMHMAQKDKEYIYKYGEGESPLADMILWPCGC
jgi:phosphoketolase